MRLNYIFLREMNFEAYMIAYMSWKLRSISIVIVLRIRISQYLEHWFKLGK